MACLHGLVGKTAEPPACLHLPADREAFEPLTPWCLLDAAKVKLFGRRVSPEALYAMAELFLTNGDMCAWLYTGSQVSCPNCTGQSAKP